MASDYNDRTRLMAFRSFFAPVGALVVNWLFAFSELDIFEDNIEGMRWIGLLVGALLIVLGLIPAIFCKEVHFHQAATQEKVSVLQSVLGLLKINPLSCS